MRSLLKSAAGFFLLIGSLLAGAENPSAHSPLTVKVDVGGKYLPREAGQPICVPYGARDIYIHIGDISLGDPSAKRVRYRLKGEDAGWRQTNGEARIGVRFYNGKNVFIVEESFLSQGLSSGWKDNPDNSNFTHRRHLVTAPPEAKSLQVFISSAGPATTVGIYVVSDILLSRLSSSGKAGAVLVDSSTFLAGEKESSPDSSWIEDGNKPSMAKLLQTGGLGLRSRAFCLLDDSPRAHAEWHQRGTSSTHVEAGDRLVLQWNEMFSLGDANSFEAIYPILQPGSYRLFVNEVTPEGAPTGQESVTDILVPQPLWKNYWIWSLGGAALAFFCFFLIRALIQANIKRKLERLQQEHMVEQERLRIARDIHDDLGARLTQISMVSGRAEAKAETANDRAMFGEMSSMARDLVSAMYETVWTVNPENDHLESLTSYLCQSTENLCRPANIACRINASDIDDNRPVRSETRHNIILSVKEIVHNAIKHSQASEIELVIAFHKDELEISISDNGQGFDLATHRSGYGLANLERRMEVAGGRVIMESSPAGTQARLTIPIPPS